jgi:hypothetical protein
MLEEEGERRGPKGLVENSKTSRTSLKIEISHRFRALMRRWSKRKL